MDDNQEQPLAELLRPKNVNDITNQDIVAIIDTLINLEYKLILYQALNHHNYLGHQRRY